MKKMKNLIYYFSLFMVGCLLLVQSTACLGGEVQPRSADPSDPFVIQSNEDLALNPYITGTGSLEDPFVLEGLVRHWDESGMEDDVYILIENTDAHFVLRDCELTGGNWETGRHLVKINDAENIIIANNTISVIDIESSNNIIVGNNSFNSMLCLTNCNTIDVVNNTGDARFKFDYLSLSQIWDNDLTHASIAISHSDQLLILNNTVVVGGDWHAMRFSESEEILVINNTLEGKTQSVPEEDPLSTILINGGEVIHLIGNNITAGDNGITVNSHFDLQLHNNTIDGNEIGTQGIFILNSPENKIINNTVVNFLYEEEEPEAITPCGIAIIGNSHNNTITDNTIANIDSLHWGEFASIGLYIVSSNNTIANNSFSDISGVFPHEGAPSGIAAVIIGQNTSFADNDFVSCNVGGLFLNSKNTNVTNNNVLGDETTFGGFAASFAGEPNEGTFFYANSITTGMVGILLMNTSSSVLKANMISEMMAGIQLENVINASISHNEIEDSEIGIMGIDSVNSTIFNNSIFDGGESGIICNGCVNASIFNNTIQNNPAGIILNSAENTTIVSNLLADGEVGLDIIASINTLVTLNSFISNEVHISLCEESEGSVFSSGGLGNYYDDYEEKYPDAFHNGTIWDTPYQIYGGIGDFFPLVLPGGQQVPEPDPIDWGDEEIIYDEDDEVMPEPRPPLITPELGRILIIIAFVLPLAYHVGAILKRRR